MLLNDRVFMLIFLNNYMHRCKLVTFVFAGVLESSIHKFYSTTSSHNSSYNMDLFTGKPDRFRGIIVKDPEEFPNDVDEFKNKLLNSLENWTLAGFKAVWFYISLKNAKYIPILSDQKFFYHRVNDHSGQTLVMCRWLPNTECHVPPYAHTMVGSGAVVINDENKLLVVLQEYGSLKTWKLPGGYVEPNEEIDEAAIREVEEETGIKTKFKSTILFRHSHQANFDCSDLYYISVLEPISNSITSESHEVLNAKWMPLEEYLNHPEVHELNKRFINIYLEQEKKKVHIVKEKGIHPVNKKPFSLYYSTIK